MRALITGISGQVGSTLAEYLLSLGYEVYGLIRRTSSNNNKRIKHIEDKIKLVTGDLSDSASLLSAINDTKPNEIYNLGAQSFVPASWSQPLLTGDVDALGVARLLECILASDRSIKFYQASSSEMFGKVTQEPQDEKTRFHPRSPYAVAKTYGHWITINYRESFNLFACCGISFNHEGEKRGPEFVTRKISIGAASIKLGLMNELHLGNLDAERDWGYTGDYVKAMHLILQQSEPDDYVIATGEKHTVREFADVAFRRLDLDYRDYVRVDDSLFRPAEVATLCGDSSKLRLKTGWRPERQFVDLVHLMVDSDYHRLAKKMPSKVNVV